MHEFLAQVFNCHVDVRITPVTGDFLAYPVGEGRPVLLAGNLDLCHDQTGIGAGIDVHLPGIAFIRNEVAGLFQNDAEGLLCHFLGIGKRNVIFELVAGEEVAADLDRQFRSFAIHDANTNGTILAGRNVSLQEAGG
ncbi:hypothetical protein D3C73_1150760 [compost metagenome]